MIVKDRISALQQKMADEKIDAFIVFSADPHMSEYLPIEWKERPWLTGFTGSAGFVVITKNKAALWTDGRYFTQAEMELKDSGVELMRDGVEGTPNFIDWIISETCENATIAVNALLTSHANWELLEGKLSANNRKLVSKSLIDEIWKDKPEASKNVVFTQPIKWAGKSVAEKLSDIRSKMKEQKATAHIITSLDDIAWTLNLRGSDVQCNPVFLAYILIKDSETTLFVGEEKLNDEAKNQLKNSDVNVKKYSEFFNVLKTLKDEKVLVSTNTNQAIFEALKDNNTFVVAAVPSNLMKAQKNETELEGFRTVMQRDGLAMVKFLYWLTHNVGKEAMDEFSIGKKLRDFRAEGKNFVGESFGSIIGYKANGAIIHYSAKKDNCKEVSNEGSILVDSGGQYLEGTTDITRTLPLGAVSEEFKRDSTLVLKGMISLSMLKFPKGTRGVQLDAIARMPLWKNGKDYGHGTGHGVGSFMNVHEGPQNIRKDMNPQELMPGMVCSNEPGFYINDKYGIRHENLIAVKESETTDFGTFYEFETLTICPFFKETIVKELLSEEEIKWLNDYHKFCEEKLAPDLEGNVKDWFLELVKPL